MKWQEVGENCIVRSFIAYTLCQVLLECSSKGGYEGHSRYHEWGKKNGYRILTRKPERRRMLARPKT
jgi:hypothetical protein